MDGLGHGYGAFVERLISDFRISSQIVAQTNTENPSHQGYPHPHHHSGYVMGHFNSSPNAFTMNGDSPSSTSTSMSSMNNGYHDLSQEGSFHKISDQGVESRSTDTDLVPKIQMPIPMALEQGAGSSISTNLIPEISIPTQIPMMSEQQPGSGGDTRILPGNPIQMPNVPNPTRHRGHHRRAHSDIVFQLPGDLSLDHEPNILEPSVVRRGTSDDLFSMYVHMDNKINSHSSMFPELSAQQVAPLPHHTRTVSVDRALSGVSRHQHSASMDGFVQELFTSDLLEYKKPMPPEKLAELALMDPKRAKRIMANRQSAARSKERKVRHISELERRVQTLQNESTTLSAQINLLQRDTSGLTTENNELRLRLQSMEQQAQLHDALSDALREEIQRLKVVTGPSNTFNGSATFLQPTNHQFNPLQSQLPSQSMRYRYTNQTQG